MSDRRPCLGLIGALAVALSWSNAGWAQPLTAPTTSTSPSTSTNLLEVNFKGLSSSEGQICLRLFAGPKGFPGGGTDSDLAVSRCDALSAGNATVTLENLKPGTYAITVYHDRNNDGKMNKTSFGFPEEGFGFSNNPELGFSSPSFDETKFEVKDSKTTIQIQMRYL
ncbi:MAG TPA: DUF2141 domain-containing protein [Stenomitos sp.]